MDDALTGFDPATREWFLGQFAAPTPAQDAAWGAIRSGRHALVIAPTGSGKTLAAFLHSIDTLLTTPRDPSRPGVRVLYISPLKALAVDVQRNLTVPLRGITEVLARQGRPTPDIRVGLRSGDTPSADRRRLVAHPPDILITTPESLFLMLSSQAGATLADVRTIIVDEVHALAGTKRGAHLGISLERVAALARGDEPQRIGLSATVRPPTAAATFLGGAHRPVDIISPPADKTWRLDIVVPVDDMTDLATPSRRAASARVRPSTVVTAGGRGAPAWMHEPDEHHRTAQPARDEAPPTGSAPTPGDVPSLWPHIEEAVLDRILAHHSTICFVNSRGIAERLTSHLNERYAARLGLPPPDPGPMPSVYAATANVVADTQPGAVIARAHHGSMSKARRAEIEAELKSGRLACVVATSSLELGIDMGAVDLVIQIGSPPSVASGLQRVGRAGHQVGAVSQGVLFPTSRADLLESAVVVQRMRDAQIEPIPALHNPLDILAQQIVSMCLDASPTPEEVFTLVRRAAGFEALPRTAFDGVLDMLTGHYPSDDFAELRPRLVRDAATGRLRARPGARHLVTTSGGTIPDRGLFGVFVTGDATPDAPTSGRHAVSRRVGELDEEMVFESRVGDIITLGSSSWRVEAITPNQVQVSPAPGQAGRLPFWHGDAATRPVALGQAIGDFVHRLGEAPPDQAERDAQAAGLDARAASNLVAYLSEQRRATRVLPDATTVLVERYRDEMGDWRVCVHCPLGLGVLRPWMLAVQHRIAERWGMDAQVVLRNDGAILRFPDADQPPPGAGLFEVPPDDIDAVVTQELFGSALFAARFRECSARALLLPRRDPGRRSPLWQQRLRSAQLLSVAAGFPDFPLTLEAMRECLDDVFDMPALRRLLGDIAARRIQLVEVETASPSPFARCLQFGLTGEFVYNADQPLAERAVAAAGIDTALLAQLLGRGHEEALDPQVVHQMDDELQRIAPPRRARSAEQLWDMLRLIGPLTPDECAQRCATTEAPVWLDDLTEQGRLARATVAGRAFVTVETDAGLLAGLQGDPVSQPVIDRIAARWIAHHVLADPGQIAARFGIPRAGVAAALDAMVAAGQVRSGRFLDAAETDLYADADMLARARRRAAAQLRARVRPVPQAQYGAFLPVWQELDRPGRGVEALASAIDLLAGYPVPASMLETMVLPARVADYAPAMLDELLSTGEVVWTGAGALGQRDGWIRLWPADQLVAPDTPAPDADAARLLERLLPGGAWRAADLSDDALNALEVERVLWRLAWSGLVTSDTFAPVRALTQTGATLRRPRTPRPGRALLGRVARPLPTPAAVGRWSALRSVSPDQAATPRTAVLARLAGLQLARYGVLTRGSVLTEPDTPSFAEVYRVLAAMEERGLVRRGYFVADLGAAQFALPGAVDRLRENPRPVPLLLAATDPANAWGAALPWPDSDGHRPTRKAGALVVLDAGEPVCYVERGAHTLVTFGRPSSDVLARALGLIGDAVDAGRLESVVFSRINGSPALGAKSFADPLMAAGFRMVPQGYRRHPRS